MSIIIGLTGEKLSGKGTVSKYLIEKYKAKHYRFSKILDDIIERLYLPRTRENEIAIALGLRDKFGNEILAHVLKKDIENNPSDISIIDGIRYWEEYNILKNLPGFIFIYITAPLEIRYQRALQREEKTEEKNLSLEDFTKQESGPTEAIIKDISKEANYCVTNDQTIEDLYQKIEEILCQVQK
jgi:dephospho-CoA kinase